MFDFRKRKAKVPVLCLTFDFNPRAQDTERTAILMLFLFYPQQVVVLLPVCRSHCLIHITKQNSHKRRNAHWDLRYVFTQRCLLYSCSILGVTHVQFLSVLIPPLFNLINQSAWNRGPVFDLWTFNCSVASTQTYCQFVLVATCVNAPEIPQGKGFCFPANLWKKKQQKKRCVMRSVLIVLVLNFVDGGINVSKIVPSSWKICVCLDRYM